MATYGHLYPFKKHIYTQIVCIKISQYIYRQEADSHYTKMAKLWCNNTQFPRRGLQCQSSYLGHMVTNLINTTMNDK